MPFASLTNLVPTEILWLLQSGPCGVPRTAVSPRECAGSDPEQPTPVRNVALFAWRRPVTASCSDACAARTHRGRLELVLG